MRRHRYAWSVAALVLLLVAIRALADNDDCLTCHTLEGFDASEHAAFECTSCHTHIQEGPHDDVPPQRVALETCATCHEEAVAQYSQGAHSKAQGGAGAQADHGATCADCHGNMHQALGHSNSASPMHWSRQAKACARCHADVELVDKLELRVARPVEAYLQSAHARAVEAGKHGAVCSDCHGAHAILPSNDTASHLARANVPSTCGTCHAEISEAYRNSVHGNALALGVAEAPSCTDCHGEHKILGPSEPTSPVFAANIPGETCGRCHANERLSEKLGLGLGKVSAFQDSYHGLALRAGQLTVANCASCHGVHDIRSSRDPLSHVHVDNLARTCGKCHPGAGETLRSVSVHGAPDSNNTKAVAWVRYVYLWLIGLTVGFMFLHNLLDLVHKARRPAVPQWPAEASPRERMSRSLRWQHRLVMISFPILVYTGFALTYPEAWWAAPLLRWETRLGLRGLIHRGAGVVLLLAVVWHLLHVLCRRPVRQRMRAFLPRWHDLGALFGTLAFYLGARQQRPHSGSVSYIEKLEYWAFLWGCAMMGATGFVLWFENITMRYLPGWVLDVATALHFYEAILATLSILIWHLYWVIFDPDVYPMDWTWWNGQPPPSRVAERKETDSEP